MAFPFDIFVKSKKTIVEYGNWKLIRSKIGFKERPKEVQMSSKRGLTGVCSNEFQIMSKWGPKEFENRSN